MKPGKFTHTIAVLLSSITAMFTHSAPAAVPKSKVKVSKKSKPSKGESLLKVDPITYTPLVNNDAPLTKPDEKFPWRKERDLLRRGKQQKARGPLLLLF